MYAKPAGGKRYTSGYGAWAEVNYLVANASFAHVAERQRSVLVWRYLVGGPNLVTLHTESLVVRVYRIVEGLYLSPNLSFVRRRRAQALGTIGHIDTNNHVDK